MEVSTMAEKTKDRKTYTKEFKETTVKSIIDKKLAVSAVSRNLGISENVLHRWKSDYLANNENAFPGKGKLRPKDAELKRLQKENADLREENEILKKATAIFSRQSK